VAAACAERDRQLKDGEAQMIGVTVHRPVDAAPPSTTPWSLSPALQGGRFEPVSLTAAFEGGVG
jgi:hypothetical protein